MVWNVCQQVLHHWHDAEDAFQATFLVLARQAASIHRPESLASWLYGVACRLALKAQLRSRRQRRLEMRRPDVTADDPVLDMTLRELRMLVHEELNRLPDKHRTPLVMCYLEGKTQAEVARVLGCSREAVRGRIDRGRDRLRKRLARRGVTPGASLFASLLMHHRVLAVPGDLLQATVKNAASMAAGHGATGAISAGAAALVDAGLRDLLAKKLTLVLAAVGGLCIAAVAGIIGVRALASDPAQAIPAATARQANDGADEVASSPARAADTQMISIRGRVLDESSKPLAGADVAVVSLATQPLRSRRQGPWVPPEVSETRTDGAGSFQMRIAVTGTLRARVRRGAGAGPCPRLPAVRR